MIKDDSVEPVCRADNENSKNGTNERKQHRRFNVENLSRRQDQDNVGNPRFFPLFRTTFPMFFDFFSSLLVNELKTIMSR